MRLATAIPTLPCYTTPKLARSKPLISRYALMLDGLPTPSASGLAARNAGPPPDQVGRLEAQAADREIHGRTAQGDPAEDRDVRQHGHGAAQAQEDDGCCEEKHAGPHVALGLDQLDELQRRGRPVLVGDDRGHDLGVVADRDLAPCQSLVGDVARSRHLVSSHPCH